jgi:uncharacterized protein YndB with AHSA1/START domain
MMSERSVTHATFSLERFYDASPERVFKAFADGDAKAEWFSGTPGEWTLVRREFDFRVGGREHLSGRWHAKGTVSAFDCLYLDIIPNERIIYTYGMHLDDRHISESLATIELRSEGAGTRFRITEQGAFLDGFDGAKGREEGTILLLDRVERSLAKQPA